jgi:hypothetical protein
MAEVGHYNDDEEPRHPITILTFFLHLPWSMASFIFGLARNRSEERHRDVLDYFPNSSPSNNNDDDGGGGGGYQYNYGHGHDLRHIGRMSNEHHRSSRREFGPHESDYCLDDMPGDEVQQGYDVAGFYYGEPRQGRDDFTPLGHGYGAHPRDTVHINSRGFRQFQHWVVDDNSALFPNLPRHSNESVGFESREHSRTVHRADYKSHRADFFNDTSEVWGDHSDVHLKKHDEQDIISGTGKCSSVAASDDDLRQGLLLEEATSRIKELEDIDSRTKEKIRELEHKLEQTQDEYQSLKTSFRLYSEKSEANNGKKEEDVERWRKKHADLNTLNGQLEDQLSSSALRQKAAKEHMDDLKKKNSALAGRVESMKVEIKNLQEQLKAEQEKARKMLQEVELFPELHRRNQELEHKLSEIEAQYQQANTMRENVLCREKAQKEHMEALKQKNLKLDEDVKNVQERLRDEQQKADKMLQQVHLLPELKIRIQELEKQLSESEALHQQASQTYVGGGASFNEGEATPFLLDGAVQRVHEGASALARHLLRFMEPGNPNCTAVNQMLSHSKSLGKAAPLKYVLEAIVCDVIFKGFEHECFGLQECASMYLDPDKHRTDNFKEYQRLRASSQPPEQLLLQQDCPFSQFCRNKFQELREAIPELSEELGSDIVAKGRLGSPRNGFTSDGKSDLRLKLGISFIKLAQCVWQVHKLAFSFYPVARIYRVPEGEEFVGKFMESVIPEEEDSDEEYMATLVTRVGLMVVPGFFINRIPVRSRVFVVQQNMRPPQIPLQT